MARLKRRINWDLFEKLIIPIIIVILPLFWSVITYLDTKKVEAEVRKIEASSAFLNMQLELFEEVTVLCSQIANSDPMSRDQKNIDRFWHLYWGKLALVEKGAVESAMKHFGDLLKDPSSTQLSLKQASLEIAHKMREELAESWGVEHWNRQTDESLFRFLGNNEKVN